MAIGAIIKPLSYLLIALLVIGSLWHISNLKADLATAKANEISLKQSIELQKELMEMMKKDVAQIQEANSQLFAQAEKQREEVKALSDRFNVNAKGEARDFGAIAAEKPKIVERLINRGSANAMRCLQIASGAPLTEAELNAKTSSEINRECPSIANPNYKPVAP
jgi:uncharacterized protein YgbK (DUF1537 family)